MAGTFSNLLYHIIFSTKNRAPLITDQIRKPLYEYIGGIIREEGGTLLEIGGVADHVHILARLKPAMAVADAVRLIKSNSSKWLNKGAGFGDFRWQAGYGAFTAGKSMVVEIGQYILNQDKHHRKRTFKEEFLDFLAKNDVEYDEKYIWD